MAQRLYIGNIPVSASDGEIRDVLCKYGEVSSIELKTKANISEASNSKTFAYADVCFASEKKFTNCLNDEVTMKGSQIRIQVAKEHFLKRLERERDCVTVTNGHANEERYQNKQPVQRQRFNDDDDVAKKTMFQRLDLLSPPIRDDEQAEVPETRTKQQLDDEKRLKSLLVLQEQKERQQRLIRESLQNPAARSKRIVFDYEHYSSPVANGQTGISSRSLPKTPLFDDDDDADMSLDQCLNRSSKQADQLVEMQSQFAHDSRFQVNQSFLDDDEAAHEVVGDEKSRNMGLLESVLNKPFMPSDAKPVKEILVPRYDPLSADASKYEIQRRVESDHVDQPVAKKSKKNKKKEVQKVKADVRPAETSNERFYAVSDTLSHALKQKAHESSGTTEFKFASLFGSANSDSVEVMQTGDLWTSKARDKAAGGDRGTVASGKSYESVEIVKERDLFTEHFFMCKDDPRLSEDPFFNPKVIKRLKDVMKGKLIRGMDVTLAKKNKAAKNRRSGHVYQTFKRKTDDGQEYEEKVLKNKEQFKNKKFRTRVTNKLSSEQTRLKQEKSEIESKETSSPCERSQLPRTRAKTFFANKKAKV